MSDFKAKMDHIQFRLGLRPRHCRVAYNTPQTPQLDLKGLLLREGEGKEGSLYFFFWPMLGSIVHVKC